ncbi:MAG: SRPBCC family protein [Cyanobacteria bacterium]|nr:SRPBCC family protein [Cyanobacteriota bacterium]
MAKDRHPKSQRVFEQSIYIQASATAVERCLTDLDLMHRWLNPAVRCDPVGTWGTDLGDRSRFILKLPLEPALNNQVVEREPGKIVWAFTGFFRGCDRWECVPDGAGTLLLNRFAFEIPNPLVAWGFDRVAAGWVKGDMEAQLRRLKRVAEEVYYLQT